MPSPPARSPHSRVATIRDVASAANVSIATVSRVLRGNTTVTEATRARVQRVVEELNFTPSRLGRSLAERHHAANGIVFPDLSGPYYAEVVLGYEAVASELGRSVLILSTHGRPAVRERVLDLASRVDGMVIFGRTVGDEVVTEVARRIPVGVIARPPIEVDDAQSMQPIDSVNAENFRAGIELAKHVVDSGATRPILIGDPSASPDVAERWAGMTQGFADTRTRPPTTVVAGMSESEGCRVAEELIAAGTWSGTSDNGPDAVICANDELALGVLDQLRGASIDVPGRVIVTGWDDVMAARWAGLTTVAQPMREIGAIAARLVDARISGDAGPPHHELLATRLVARTTSNRDR